MDDELKQGSPADARPAGRPHPPRTVLVLNAGSSSLKFALYDIVEGLPLLLKGAISSLTGNPPLSLSAAGEDTDSPLRRRSAAGDRRRHRHDHG